MEDYALATSDLRQIFRPQPVTMVPKKPYGVNRKK